MSGPSAERTQWGETDGSVRLSAFPAARFSAVVPFWPAGAGLALLAGAAFGVMLERLDLCFHSAFRGLVVSDRDPTRFRTYLIAVLLQIPAVWALIAAGLIQPYIPPFVPAANLAGGLLFGLGMVVTASCVSGLFYKLGRGMFGAFVGLAAWALGDILMYAGPLNPLRDAWQTQSVGAGAVPTFGGLFGSFGWAVAGLTVVALLAWLLKSARAGEWRGGLLLALVVVVAWPLAGLVGADFPFGTVGIPSQVFAWLTTGTLVGVPWVALTLLALPAGAYLSARWGGRLWVRGETPARFGQLAAGGFLLGLGGALAGGCNIGHGLIGVSLLAPGSWLATAAMIAGVWLGVSLSVLAQTGFRRRVLCRLNLPADNQERTIVTTTHYTKRSDIFPLTGLREAYLFITNRCGMGCRHCFTSSVPETGADELSTAAWRDVLRQLRELGAESIVFVGGDPFLRDDLLTLLDAATGEFDLNVRIFFNRSLPAALSAGLAEAGRGRLTMIASLDGPTEAINDRVRGTGSYQAALSAIANLQSVGLNPVLNVVPTAVNVGSLTEMAELADRLGLDRLQITLPLDRGFLRQARSLWPKSDDLTRELRRLRAREADLRVRIENFAAWEDRVGRSFDYCSAAYDLIALDDTGGVYPCQCAVGDPNLRAGLAGDAPIEDIWRRSDVFRWLRDASYQERAACRECPVAPICGGDCILHGYFAEEARTGRGTLDTVTPHCETFQAIYEDVVTESGICLVDAGNPSLLKKT